MSSPPALPELIFTENDISRAVAAYLTPGSLIITDDHNYAQMRALGPTERVADQLFEHIEEVRQRNVFTRVLAVGGCTALDFGRACAPGKELFAFPTILSTSCLSTNCSVIRRNGVYASEVTQAPLATVISVPTICENHADQIKNWSASGLGDLFASVSAAIEFEYHRNSKSLAQTRRGDIIDLIPAVSSAMEWVMSNGDHFGEQQLRDLALLLHTASLDVVVHGRPALNAASEHWLYYKMQERWNYPKMVATHGKLVSIGTLLTSAIFAEATGDFSLDAELRSIHQKIGLPTRKSDLLALGIAPEHIVAGLEDLQNRECLYRDHFSARDYSLVDRVFR